MLSENHKNAIKLLKSILISITECRKNVKIINKYNQRIDSKLYLEAFNIIKEKCITKEIKYGINMAIFDQLCKLKHNCTEYKNIKDCEKWESKIPFFEKDGSIYKFIYNSKNVWIFGENGNIILTLLYILYNKIRNKKRGHTKDDNTYIKINSFYWKAIIERMEMQQFLLENNQESTNVST